MSPANEFKRMIKIYMKVDDNLYRAERFFMANSALSWALENNKEASVITYYLKEIEKHLNEEITLFWQDGKIKVKKGKKDEK